MLHLFWCIPFHTCKSMIPVRSYISGRHRMPPLCQSIHPHLEWKSERFSSLASMQIYWNKWICIHKIRVQLPKDWLGHQHGGRFIVLWQQYVCPDSLSQNSQNLIVVKDCFKQTEEIYGLRRSIVAERLFLHYFVIKLDLIVMFFFSARKNQVFF